MRRQLIISIILVCAALSVIIFKSMVNPGAVGYATYAYTALFWLFISVAIILLFNQYYLSYLKPKTSAATGGIIRWFNRRQSYRVVYPHQNRPRLIIEKTDGVSRRNLEYAVLDLSQDGVRFMDDGSLGEFSKATGKIRMDHNYSLLIEGELVRLNNNQISLRFRHPLPWSILLEEQRKQIKGIR